MDDLFDSSNVPVLAVEKSDTSNDNPEDGENALKDNQPVVVTSSLLDDVNLLDITPPLTTTVGAEGTAKLPGNLPASADHSEADLFADCTSDVDLSADGSTNTGGAGDGVVTTLLPTSVKTPEVLTDPLLPAAVSEINLNDEDKPAVAAAPPADNPFGAPQMSPPSVTGGVVPSAPPLLAATQAQASAPPPLPPTHRPPAVMLGGKNSEADDEQDTEPILVEHLLSISVTDYERRGDGMSAYVLYKIVVKVPDAGVQGYSKKEYSVWRRFSDFLGLHHQLSVKHGHLGVVVPPPPEKSVVSMTKSKMAKSGEEDTSQSDFLDRRRAALERFLRRTALHPKLVIDCDFRDFVTMEADLPRSSHTAALSGNNVKKMFTRIGDSLTKITYRMDESDRWFEEKMNEIEKLEESLKRLHGSIDLLVHYRRELAVSTDLFCKSVSMLASCEENTALSRAFSQLAETEEKIALIQQDQTEKDFYILSESFHDYLALLMAVKEVFNERVKSWQRWQDNVRELGKKREAKTRFELAARTDKLPGAKAEVIEAEQKVQESEEAFERITKTIRREMRRFSAQRIKDFKGTLLRYLESLALTQQQMVKYWEAFLPEAKAIIT